MNLSTIPPERTPTLDTAGTRALDAAAERDAGIESGQLMEIAGFQVARVATLVAGGLKGKRVVVAAGGGNNGGDALVAARFLHQRGATVEVWMRAGQRLGPLTARHWRTLELLGVRLHDATTVALPPADLVVDGLLGTGIQLPLRPEVAALIEAVNQARLPVLAVDLPSGLDSDSGAGGDRCIRARWTVTLGLPKPALLSTPATGRLFVADIGIPAALFGSLAPAVGNLYSLGDLVEVGPLGLNPP